MIVPIEITGTSNTDFVGTDVSPYRCSPYGCLRDGVAIVPDAALSVAFFFVHPVLLLLKDWGDENQAKPEYYPTAKSYKVMTTLPPSSTGHDLSYPCAKG
jgi:hypothetical protein